MYVYIIKINKTQGDTTTTHIKKKSERIYYIRKKKT